MKNGRIAARLDARGYLSLIALAAAIAPAPAFAQTTPADADSMDEIIVTGSIVAAQGASIEAKRMADNVVDIAAADAVGRFPDQNSAAALARLPSVAVQRDQGQERYIQVRGAPNRWSSVSIDGVPVIGVDEGGETRAFRFDAVPAVLLNAMAINKSLTADIQAEAIVANIDLRTYSPLNERGLNVQADLGYGWMALGEREQRQGSLRVSWSNDNFGIVLGGSHYRRLQTTDNREVGLYDNPSDAADTTFGPTEIDIRSYRLARENNGLFAGVEGRLSDNLLLFAKAIYTEFNDDEERNQYELRLDRALSGTRNLSSGDLVRVPVRVTMEDGAYRTRYYINSLGGNYDDDDGLKGSLVFNYTRTENTTNLPLLQASTSSANSPSLHYDFSNPLFPTVQLYQTVAGATPGSFVRGPALASFDQRTVNTGTLFIPALQDTFSDSYTVKSDLEKELDGLTIKAGGLYARRDISGFTFATANAAVLAASAPTFNVGNYVTSTPWDTRFPLGFNLNILDNASARRDVEAIIAQLTQAGTFNPANNIPAINRYKLQENLVAGYVSGKFEFEGGQVIAGLRVEHFRLTNSGTAALGGGVFQQLTAKQSYTDLFPSINARFDLTDDLVARLAFQRGIARPSFGQIRIGSSINDTASPGTIGGGNPTLKPEYTWGLDASLEYYLPGRGILSVSGFHRWVDNVLYGNTQPVGSDVFNANGRDRSAYLLSATFNGESGKLYGVELNYQQQFTFLPSPFDGLGFQGNVTFLDGSFDTVQRKDIGFPGTSKRIVNASLYYEKYGLSARVSYQHRTNWLETLSLGTGGSTDGDEYRHGYENLDVALRYKLTDNFTLFADLSNLTDAIYWAFEGNEGKPTEVEQIGSRYMFGVRFSF